MMYFLTLELFRAQWNFQNDIYIYIYISVKIYTYAYIIYIRHFLVLFLHELHKPHKCRKKIRVLLTDFVLRYAKTYSRVRRFVRSFHVSLDPKFHLCTSMQAQRIGVHRRLLCDDRYGFGSFFWCKTKIGPNHRC